MLYIQKMPIMYHAYVLFPVYFWNQIIRNYRSLFEALGLCLQGGVSRFLVILAASLLFLEALVSNHVGWSIQYNSHKHFRLVAFFTVRYLQLSS